MKKINRLTELIESLSELPRKEYHSLVERLDLPIWEFEPYLFWSKDFYTRNCIVRTEDYELLVLCWEEGHKAPIHCHNGEECWFWVIDGEFRDVRQKSDPQSGAPVEEGEIIAKKGFQAHMGTDSEFHSLENIHSGRSMSLHLYAKPITKCRVFNSETQQMEWKELSYHSVGGKRQVAFQEQ